MPDHDWDISPQEAMALQARLAERVRIEPLRGPVRTVAGVDCAYLGAGPPWAQPTDRRVVAVAVLLDADSMATLATACVVRPSAFPYVPGLLSFREAPAVIEAVGKLPERPDLLMCDGQGIAHPRRLGLAAHVGLWCDLSTIGVAKSRLCGRHRAPGRRRGCRTQLRLDDADAGARGQLVGAVVRTRTGVKPLVVSPGHRASIDDAVRWTLRCGRGVRLPEPTRRAHHHVSREKRRRGGQP
ncbi:MAG: endonuclease V [Phycisphaerae bacterium]|nr:endonuclease V [Phycisphaerae bacterium]